VSETLAQELPDIPRDWLEAAVGGTRRTVVEHSIYGRICTQDTLAHFMRHHVYAVWDFMSLLKALQRHLTCVEVPWVPRGISSARRLINSIVLDEESDLVDGVSISHFELYLAAMEEVGAGTAEARAFVTHVQEGRSLETAFTSANVPLGCREFVRTTFDIIEGLKPHAIAAAFTVGREDAIPDMFTRLLVSLPEAPKMKAYLERHVDLDGGTHAEQGYALVNELCGRDRERWREAASAARSALVARARLWSSIEEELSSSRRAKNSQAAVR
jgi:hypothetical protein